MDNLNDYKNWLEDKGRSPYTINQYIAFLKRIPDDEEKISEYLRQKVKQMDQNTIAAWRSYLEYLEYEGRISTEELFKLKRRYPFPPRRGNISRGVSIPIEKWPEYIKAGKHSQARLAFAIGLKAGLRNSEIRHLRIEDIDFDRKVFLIRNRKAKKEQLAWRTKNSREREVPFDDDMAEALLDWIKNRPNFSHPYLLWNPHPSAKPGPVSAKTLLNWIKKANITVRDLRRSCITAALYETGQPRIPQLIAGHVSLDTTTEYIGSDKERAFDIFRKKMS